MKMFIIFASIMFLLLFISASFLVYRDIDEQITQIAFCEKNGFDKFIVSEGLCLDTEKNITRTTIKNCRNFKCEYYLIGDNMKIDVGGN